MGTQVAWELDFWGKFRRGVQSADAAYLASIATYDDVLVTLLGDVATTYIGIRTLQTQIAIAQENVTKQKKALTIARDRFHGGTATGLDVFQAENVLAQTASDHSAADRAVAAGRGRVARAARHGAGTARYAARRAGEHSGAAERCRHRHPRRPAAPPSGHPRRRTERRGAERADRHRQGRSVSGLQPDRRVRHVAGSSGTDRLSQVFTAHAIQFAFGPVVQLADPELWADHQQCAGAGREAAGSADRLPEHRAEGAAGGGERPRRLRAGPHSRSDLLRRAWRRPTARCASRSTSTCSARATSPPC